MSIDNLLDELKALCADNDPRVDALLAEMPQRQDGLYEPTQRVIDIFFPPDAHREDAEHWTPERKREAVFRRVNELAAEAIGEAEAEKVAAQTGVYPHHIAIAARRAARHAVGKALGDFTY